jgi:NADH-quinone oxidoreductase subunit C
MSVFPQAVTEQFSAIFGNRVTVAEIRFGVVTIEVAAENWVEVCRGLRDNAEFAFKQLTDLCGVDYLGFGQSEWETSDATSEGFSRGVEGLGPGRFDWRQRPLPEQVEHRYAVVLHLLSMEHNRRLRLRCFAPDNDMPIIPSLVDVWSSADWYEREAFDLFGIIFEGHPDLRRILTDYGFTGHPFRKDFPLIGNVAVRYDTEKKRVIYEPVEIEPRVLVPRVLRDDARYQADDIDRAAQARENEQAG